MARKNKNTFSFDNIKEWPRLFKKIPGRQQHAVYMLLVCVLAFVIVVVASSILIFGGKEEQQPSTSLPGSGSAAVDSGYNKDADSIDADKYAGVLLPKSADAGQKYMDDTLFIGDSNTVRLHDVYNLIPLKNYMGMVGMTIQGAVSAQCVFFENDLTVYTIPQAIAKVQPRRIVMCFGTNNADGNTSVDAFIKHYKTAIKEIQAAYQYSDLIILSIPPCALERAYPNVSQKTIDEFNKALVKLCEDLDLKYLNMAEDLKDPATGYIKTSYISADGLHLNDAGDKAWLNYVRTHAYETEDKRPALKDIPVRQEPPAPVAGTPVPATCTESGYTPYTLWNNTVDKRDVVAALGHDYDKATGICKRCATKDPEFKPTSSSAASSSSQAPSSSAPPASSSQASSAHTHNWVKGNTTASTCMAEGFTLYSCSCGESEQRDKTGLAAHTFGANAKCTLCGAPDTSHVHAFTEVVTPPTCIAAGFTTATCPCGHSETRNATNPTGAHNYVDGKCTTPGCTATTTPTPPAPPPTTP